MHRYETDIWTDRNILAYTTLCRRTSVKNAETKHLDCWLAMDPVKAGGSFQRPFDFDNTYKQPSKNAVAAYNTLQLLSETPETVTVKIVKNEQRYKSLIQIYWYILPEILSVVTVIHSWMIICSSKCSPITMKDNKWCCWWAGKQITNHNSNVSSHRLKQHKNSHKINTTQSL